MSEETKKRKSFLFVDDDAPFLAGIRDVFSGMARGSWEIFTAQNHGQALALLQQQRVSVLVLDLDMPDMDGLQFLRLLQGTHPGLPVVILTGHASPDSRKACLESGAALFLEKLITPEGFAAVFSALEAVAGALPQEGFRGVMRRVGLPEVLQMECLGRKSSILEVFTDKVRGRIFIRDGAIVHAESGSISGEVALYGLLALRGGEFNLKPFAEPPHRTIAGHWESLMMEAARLCDEGTEFFQPDRREAATIEIAAPTEVSEPGPATAQVPAASPVRIKEIVLCSGSGEIVYEWECASPEHRLLLLEQIEQQATRLSSLGSLGRFQRLEILNNDGRIVCETQPHRRLFVRSAPQKQHPREG